MQKSLQETIDEFKAFNAHRMEVWEGKPIIGELLNQNKFLSYGIRFSKSFSPEIENCGMGIFFKPIQEIK